MNQFFLAPSPGPKEDAPPVEVALWLLASTPRTPEATAAFFATTCKANPRPTKSLAEGLLGHLERRGLLTAGPFRDALAQNQEALQSTPSGIRLLAHYAERAGDFADAARWFRLLEDDNLPAQDSTHLDLVRVLYHLGEHAEALAVLRRAAGSSMEFAFLAKAAKQLLRLKEHAAKADARCLRIALLHPYTTDLWVPLLRLQLFRAGFWPELLVPAYGTHEQTLLDPSSALYSFAPDLVILAPTWRELNLPAFSEDPERAIQEQTENILARWKHLQARLPARIIQHNFEVPAVDPNGNLGDTHPGGRATIIRRINADLSRLSSTHHVSILNLDQVAASHGKRTWSDPTAWFTAKQYPAPAALPSLIDAQVTRVQACLGLTKKVLVLDLDNTLWGGVIGEDGLAGIQIGPPSATGEAHLALQKYVSQLKERGILLAVCSKNNLTDAQAPFLNHEGMHLKLGDFAAFTANWEPKANNLRMMAQDLKLGLSSFVFLDDNPTERARMRLELPEVAVPEIGSDPARYVDILDGTGYFDADFLSPEDLKRSSNYANNLKREAFKSSAADLDMFLNGLTMVCEHGKFDDHVMGRVVQLLGKTNQFNLTTRRHGDTKVRVLAADPRGWTQYFRLKDKFDDNGLVGLMIAVPVPEQLTEWEVDTWLMSCRVIGRKLENYMFNILLLAARERGITKIRALYLPTAKNGMVATLLSDMGFQELESSKDGGRAFAIETWSAALRPDSCIQGLS